jgi:ABC-type multidrug transport system fused ATPase/permease subunit
MSSLIFCPHTDDAIFSLGDYIIDNDHSFTIASAFAGIPTDELGYKKHTKLRQEHDEACSMINAKVINGELLDDVYGRQDKEQLINWIKNVIVNFENVYIPLGIYHPDHVFLSDTLFNLMKDFNKTYFIYAELPYRLLYPELHELRIKQFEQNYNLKNVSATFPLGKFICVTGVSGSGKSTLINETLYPILNQHFYRSHQKPLKYKFEFFFCF